MANTTKTGRNPNPGIYSCCRYAYPPNSLSLCGPISQRRNLNYYSTEKITDYGTREILDQFSTLAPYLSLIAYENSIRDPYDERVIDAYWLGNSLLKKVRVKSFHRHLTDKIKIRKIIPVNKISGFLNKLNFDPLPHHSFHVLNIYKRTGNIDLPHTVATMDACLINWGRVIGTVPGKVKIKTQRLVMSGNKLTWEKNITRYALHQGNSDSEARDIRLGDYISYHWGYFCRKLTLLQLANLKHYTILSINSANSN